jgi:ParB family chromosome partitioning protein
MSADTPKRLGRGLEALLATARQQREAAQTETPSLAPQESDLKTLPIAEIAPNRFQPRRAFKEQELAELESSLKSSGLLQPITVRRRGTGWELVAGERRLRAATRLGWTEIPAVVRDFDDQAMLTLALVENLQRSDLNAIEEAEGYQRLTEEFGLTQQQVADVVGKDRTTITNLLRLLGLPSAVRKMVEAGQLSNGHARALLVLKDERRITEVAQHAVARQWSVRDLEAVTREQAEQPKSAKKRTQDKQPSPYSETNADPALRRIEEQLRRKLQTDVSIQQTSADRGLLRIAFYGSDDLERLLDLVLGPRGDFD